MKKFSILAVILGAAMLLPAESNQEVPIYKIADIPSDGIYKLVHHGCALYVMREKVFQMNHGDAVALAIATGEGCR